MKNSRIFANPGLKIASLIIAFAIWLVIMNTSNPEVTHTYTGINVNVTNASYVESRQQMYAMIDRIRTISVTVHTNRKIIERLSPSGITATADLTQIEDFTSPVYVPVTVTVPGVSADDVTINPRMIEITLEDIETKEFVVNPTTAGTTPSKGYEVGKLTASPDRIKIKGPKSIVEKIDQVNAEAMVTGISKDQTLTANLAIYDKNGDKLSDSQENSLTIGDGSTSVKVKVTLFTVVSDVPIAAETYGAPAAGFQIGEVSTTPANLKLVGDPDIMEKFRSEGGTITIPSASGAVDILGADEDRDISIDITEYLPPDISLAADMSETVVVSVKILPYNSKSIEIDTKGILKKNLPKNYTAVFNDSKLDIRVTADDAALEELSAEDIGASVDLRDVEPGETEVPVDVILPEGCSLVEQVTAGMSVSRVTVKSTDSQKSDDQS